MQEISLSDFNEAIDDIFHDFEHFWFSQSFFLFEDGAEVAFITKFSDDVAVRGFSDDVVAFEYVGMLEFGECFDLAI